MWIVICLNEGGVIDWFLKIIFTQEIFCLKRVFFNSFCLISLDDPTRTVRVGHVGGQMALRYPFGTKFGRFPLPENVLSSARNFGCDYCVLYACRPSPTRLSCSQDEHQSLRHALTSGTVCSIVLASRYLISFWRSRIAHRHGSTSMIKFCLPNWWKVYFWKKTWMNASHVMSNLENTEKNS